MNKKEIKLLLDQQLKYIQELSKTKPCKRTKRFEKFIFPIIQSVYPNLIAEELVNVQPMTNPEPIPPFVKFPAFNSTSNPTYCDACNNKLATHYMYTKAYNFFTFGQNTVVNICEDDSCFEYLKLKYC